MNEVKYSRPDDVGLYRSQLEKDACGVGMICNLKGKKSHEVIANALKILENLAHRGASGSDAKTGDGAGILIQVPHRFLVKKCQEIGIALPGESTYAVGLVLLPKDENEAQTCVLTFEKAIKEEGLDLLGWRQVPVNESALGAGSMLTQPKIVQLFLGQGKKIKNQDQFERKLFVLRKIMENNIRGSELKQKKFFYIPSLSSRTLNYKGMFLADQLRSYYPDLSDTDMESGLALVHQRYSTNTFPSWDLAQPFRFLCHNGEINTLRANINWMSARESMFESPLFGEDMKKIFPIITPGSSDSASLDNAVELLYHSGRSLPHAIMMLIPEAWQNHNTMKDEKKAFYEYHSCLMEPWDGPASIPFTDGKVVGAILDRNGLRPSRYLLTKDGFVIMASETGVLDIAPENVLAKGRLQPGRMFLVDTDQGKIIDDEQIKSEICQRKPYRSWLFDNQVRLDALPKPSAWPQSDVKTLTKRQRLYGYTLEDKKFLLTPMVDRAMDPVGSMGSDFPLAVLSKKPQLLYNYFMQLFAQVSNPPLDALREAIVTSLVTNIGSERDLFGETSEHCRQIRLNQPILTNEELGKLKEIVGDEFKQKTFKMRFPVADGGSGLEASLQELCLQTEDAVNKGYTLLILSDRDVNQEYAPIPALLATGAVHHHLIRVGLRTRAAIIVESAEPREVHHFCLLFGYGAGAVNPYLAFETIEDMVHENVIRNVDSEKATNNYIKAVGKGLLKVMSKMGISTLHSYRGAQIFEIVGLHQDVVNQFFTWTVSRVGGLGLEEIAKEVLIRHEFAYHEDYVPSQLGLNIGGIYQWRRDGEHHLFNPLTIAKLQQAARQNDQELYNEYASLINDQSQAPCTLRGLFSFKKTQPIPISEVESVDQIVKRFKTGAMSYGSLSKEVHETLAIAMNYLGGKSNSGEGGEDEERYIRMRNGDSRRSAIKQVASGRFGVTSHYLANADELQIKMAQGAKPGEGGQLPGEKVYPWIAKTRHSTPYVSLISPPPHHDIYSIEDMAQLIHDLKNANRDARINVKLVSEVGVGIVAAGVAKGKADVILVSGWDGGTGASPQTSLKHAGLPWELGIAETHQTLVMNNLRSRVAIEADGQMKTGRDVAIACLLGAEEFGFGTAPLVVAGCIMMRVCHLNTCPAGVATQNPDLRKKYQGRAEYVVNYFYFVANELRQIMAQLGIRTMREMVGRSDLLETNKAIEHWKTNGLDFSALFFKPESNNETTYCSKTQDHGLEKILDKKLIEKAQPALRMGKRVVIDQKIVNTDRTVGTMLSHEISKLYGSQGLPEDSIVINCQGSAGQSFAAFGAKGLSFHIFGDANDYLGKGLSGAKISIQPPQGSSFIAQENIIIGNVALYGATSGELYVRGQAGERFCVRNSGAKAVVEGVGDHGCEYMTGGVVVVIGKTGRNFAAGMSGGIAYVYDEKGDFVRFKCNKEMVEFESMTNPEDMATLHDLLVAHQKYTGSTVAKDLLDNWDFSVHKFVKIMPIEYKKALERIKKEEAEPMSVA